MAEDISSPTIHSIKLLGEALFAGVTVDDGQVERPLPDGGIVIATYKDGAIVEYAAYDKDKNPLTVFLLKMVPGEPLDDASPLAPIAKSCWFCFCDDNHCQCTPDRCPDPPM
jgi:hypothetical protein